MTTTHTEAQKAGTIRDALRIRRAALEHIADYLEAQAQRTQDTGADIACGIYVDRLHAAQEDIGTIDSELRLCDICLLLNQVDPGDFGYSPSAEDLGCTCEEDNR